MKATLAVREDQAKLVL
jgi:hypothetical protein